MLIGFDRYPHLPSGPEWMIRGAYTTSLRVLTAPLGRCRFRNVTLPVKWFHSGMVEASQSLSCRLDFKLGPMGPLRKIHCIDTWWFKVTSLGWLSDPFKGLSDIQRSGMKFGHFESPGTYFLLYFITLMYTLCRREETIIYCTHHFSGDSSPKPAIDVLHHGLKGKS